MPRTETGTEGPEASLYNPLRAHIGGFLDQVKIFFKTKESKPLWLTHNLCLER